MQVENLINANDSAVLLKMHKPDFYKLMNEVGLIPAMQTGRIKLYYLRDVEQLKWAIRNKEAFKQFEIESDIRNDYKTVQIGKFFIKQNYGPDKKISIHKDGKSISEFPIKKLEKLIREFYKNYSIIPTKE